MARITYSGKSFEHKNGTVLDTLIEAGEDIPYSCREGVCQSCMVRAVSGRPSAHSQRDLKETLVKQGCFLACQCHPEEDLEIALPDTQLFCTDAELIELERLSDEIMRVILRPSKDYHYYAGQFLNIKNSAGIVRSYSLASLPQLGGDLELHMQYMAGGKMTEWLFNDAAAGDRFEVSEAQGDCFYTSGRPDQSILFVATGSGLAPIYGVIRDALLQGHSGPMHLFHGSRHISHIYLQDELRDLAEKHKNFQYSPCLTAAEQVDGYYHQRANEAALDTYSDLKSWRVFACGHPDMVKDFKKKAFLAGASLSDIHIDAFVTAKS